jgi:alkylated DNA repair dioxygenase AlkB
MLNPECSPTNLLPFDGELFYYGKIFPATQADFYFGNLIDSIDWKPDEVFMFGKHIQTKRKIAWYADGDFPYRYSGSIKTALPFTPVLRELKTYSENLSSERYNSCLANLYHDGREGMAWHSDAEPELKKRGAIASLSFGAERKFSFKHKRSGKTVSLILEHGSLLVMAGSIQENWLHRLPPTARITAPRINLTFRCVNTQD